MASVAGPHTHASTTVEYRVFGWQEGTHDHNATICGKTGLGSQAEGTHGHAAVSRGMFGHSHGGSSSSIGSVPSMGSGTERLTAVTTTPGKVCLTRASSG